MTRNENIRNYIHDGLSVRGVIPRGIVAVCLAFRNLRGTPQQTGLTKHAASPASGHSYLAISNARSRLPPLLRRIDGINTSTTLDYRGSRISAAVVQNRQYNVLVSWLHQLFLQVQIEAVEPRQIPHEGNMPWKTTSCDRNSSKTIITAKRKYKRSSTQTDEQLRVKLKRAVVKLVSAGHGIYSHVWASKCRFQVP